RRGMVRIVGALGAPDGGEGGTTDRRGSRMSRSKPQPAECRCACGAPLAWEARETFRDSRSLALCSNPDCGRIPTSPDGRDDGDLRTFLLGDTPVRRELRPWTRFFFRATS